jgi:hypothetical protein
MYRTYDFSEVNVLDDNIFSTADDTKTFTSDDGAAADTNKRLVGLNSDAKEASFVVGHSCRRKRVTPGA